MCTLRCCASNALHCDALHAILCVTKKPCNTSPGTGKTDLRAPVLPGFTFKRFSLSSECSRLHKREHRAPVSIDDCTALRRRQPSKREKSYPRSEQNTTPNLPNARAVLRSNRSVTSIKNVRKHRTNATYARNNKAKTLKFT